MKVLTVSRTFPAYHPRKGEPTYFVEKILGAIPVRNWGQIPKEIDRDFSTVRLSIPKLHTIRSGSRWKAGEMASLRYWSGRPYNSKQVEFAQVEIKKVWPIKIVGEFIFNQFDNVLFAAHLDQLATNDGLSVDDLRAWFKMPRKETFIGQIICWSDKVNY